jgi:hypothetical protein
MSRHFLGVAILAAFVSTNLRAEEPKIAQLSATTATPIDLSAGQVTATPEMWFYTQELRRYDDPRNAIRAQAAMKTAQRNARLAAMQWYGLSNSRPLTGVDCLHGVYAPRWVSNGYNPAEWVGAAGATTIYYAPRSGY